MDASFISIILTLFIVSNPVGCSPAIIALIKDFDFEHQKRIMLRETIAAFLLAIFFQYAGGAFLDQLLIEPYVVKMCGGILLIFVSLRMIFPPPHAHELKKEKIKKEPIIVPIAMPLIAGPALLTMIMVYSQDATNPLFITLAITVTWIGVGAVLLSAPYLNKFIGKRGLDVLERLMGMVLTLLAVEMILGGLKLFGGKL